MKAADMKPKPAASGTEVESRGTQTELQAVGTMAWGRSLTGLRGLCPKVILFDLTYHYSSVTRPSPPPIITLMSAGPAHLPWAVTLTCSWAWLPPQTPTTLPTPQGF